MNDDFRFFLNLKLRSLIKVLFVIFVLLNKVKENELGYRLVGRFRFKF